MSMDRPWIPELELPDANIKWGFSNFAGREDTFTDAGDHNFTVILPPEMVPDLLQYGWNIKEREAYEEGDPPEHLLKIKISYRFEAPKVYLIKNGRKYKVENPAELADITRPATEQIDVIVKPVPWAKNGATGVAAFVEEMYVQIKSNRFSEKYADFEEVR